MERQSRSSRRGDRHNLSDRASSSTHSRCCCCYCCHHQHLTHCRYSASNGEDPFKRETIAGSHRPISALLTQHVRANPLVRLSACNPPRRNIVPVLCVCVGREGGRDVPALCARRCLPVRKKKKPSPCAQTAPWLTPEVTGKCAAPTRAWLHNKAHYISLPQCNGVIITV